MYRSLTVVLLCVSVGHVAHAAPSETCDGAADLVLPSDLVVDLDEEVVAAPSPCGIEDIHARWYRFTAPADTTVDDRFTFIAEGAALDPTLALFDACGAAARACNDDGAHTLDARIDSYLEPEQTVWLRVGAWGRQTGEVRLRVDRFDHVEAPANDLCEHAIAITQEHPGAAATWLASGTDLSSCGPEDRVDIWYSFVAPTAGEYEFVITQNLVRAHYVTVFDGCGGSELACGFLSTKATLGAGQAVRLRIGTNPSTADWFNVVVRPGPPAATPVNDDFAHALPVSLGTRVVGSTRAATPDPIDDWGIDCPGFVNSAIWYRFVAPDDDVYVFDTAASDLEDTVVALFDDCDANGALPPDLFVCNDYDGDGDHGRIDGFVEAGTALCIAVAGHFLSEEGEVALDVTRLGPPPVNDECQDALPIAVGEPIFGVNYASAPVDVTSTCPDGNFPLWYVFTAPADGLYKFDTKAGSDSWPDLALYHDCQSATPLACSVEAQPALGLELHAGESVRVRVSTVLSWRGTIPLRVWPVPVEAPVVEEDAGVEVVEEVADEDVVVEDVVVEEEDAVVEVDVDARVEVEGDAVAEARASGGCGCAAGGGDEGWVMLVGCGVAHVLRGARAALA